MASTTLKENTQTSVSKPLFGSTSIDEAVKEWKMQKSKLAQHLKIS